MRHARSALLVAAISGWATLARAQAVDPAPPEAVAHFEGEAAPSTSAATSEHVVRVRPGLEVFAEYAFRHTEHAGGDSSWFHEFDVPRIHLALDAEVDDAHGRVVIEGVRSAAEGALIGVAGDSIVFRAREAYAGYRFEWLSGRAGLVPTLTLPELEGTWMLRAVSAAPEEINGVYSPADVGATLRASFPLRYGYVALGAYNGEGYNQRELNRGKNAEIAAAVHPVPYGLLLPLAILASYQLGSTGTGLARADRATGAVLWQGRWLRGGISTTYAWGLNDDGERRVLLLDGFVRAEPIPRVLAGLRATRIWVDVAESSDAALSTVVAAIGYRIADPLEAFVAAERSIPSDDVRLALPGSDYWEARAVTRVVF